MASLVLVYVFSIALLCSQCSGKGDAETSESTASSYSSSTPSSEESSLEENDLNDDIFLEKEKQGLRTLRHGFYVRALDHIASSVVPDLKLMLGSRIPVQDLHQEVNQGQTYLTLTYGNITKLRTLYDMRSNLLRVNQDYVEFEMHFSFKALHLHFLFEYSSTTFGFTRSKEGRVVLHLKGRNVITVHAVMPNSLIQIFGTKTDKSECYLTVKSVTMTAVGLALTATNVQYPSLANNIGFGVTSRGLKILIMVMRGKILQEVRRALQSATESAVTALYIVCSE